MKEERIVVGCKGLVGKAIANVFNATFGIDVGMGENYKSKTDNHQILHIAIPYNKYFTKDVKNYIDTIKPDMVLIHTTCKVGSTREIQEYANMPVLHCPVDGVHEVGTKRMEIDIRKYGMCVGGINRKDVQYCCAYVHRFGIMPFMFYNPEITETCKILQTNRMTQLVEFDNKVEEHFYNNEMNYNDYLIYMNRLRKVFSRIHTFTGKLDEKISGKHCFSDNKGLIDL